MSQSWWAGAEREGGENSQLLSANRHPPFACRVRPRVQERLLVRAEHRLSQLPDLPRVRQEGRDGADEVRDCAQAALKSAGMKIARDQAFGWSRALYS